MFANEFIEVTLRNPKRILERPESSQKLKDILKKSINKLNLKIKMETEKTMNSEESIQLIQRMINTAKENIEDESFYYLFWGWLVFTACAMNYILIEISYPHNWIGWMILMPLGGIVTMIYGYKQEKKKKVHSYINDIMKYVLIAFLVSLLTVLFFMGKLGPATYPLVMIIYGIWLFISGGAIKFKPLIWGGIVNWVLAIAAFFAGFEQQLILLALAVLLGYIIPGHLLKRKYSLKMNN
jgi:hypothetical protein